MAKNIFEQLSAQIDADIDKKRREGDGEIQYNRARKPWNISQSHKEMDVPIEDLLNDDNYLGRFKTWPSVKEELCQIWHNRCDFNVRFHNGYEILKEDTVYAMSHEHALRRAKEKWPRIARQADRVRVWRDKNQHTVVLELPKGTGKDYEISLCIWLLTREFLIMDREEFFDPYELDLETTISITLMNRSEEQAKKVTFSEILSRFDVPFFRDYFPPQVDLEEMGDKRRYPSELRFPKNVVIFPGTGSAASGLGYCIGASVIDEANFLQKTDSGKRSIMGADGYDAAAEAYADLLQRQQSRFGALREGIMCYAGLTFIISSSRTRNDFTQQMKAKSLKDPGILYICKPFWERKPLDLSGETFRFDLNSMSLQAPEKSREAYKKLITVPDGLEAE